MTAPLSGRHRLVRPLRGLAGVVVAALLLSLAAPTAARAAFPGRNGRIAFTANLHGSWQLFTMQPDGTGVRQLTHLPAPGDLTLFQSWAPGGGQLAFSSSRSGTPDLYRINADGTGLRQITSGPAEDYAPSWSPDGTRLAFARVLNGRTAAIYTADADGTHLRRLTSPAYDSFLPRYTPDGRHIVFESSKGGLVAAVWIMNVDGSGAHRLTPPAFQGFPWDVSPDGKSILLGNNGNAHLPTSLFVMKLDGTGLRRLTDAGCCFKDSNARFSPDGRLIAFTTNRSFAGGRMDQDEIWVMTADGKNPHPVTSSLTLGGCPDEMVDNCVGPVDWGRRR